MDLPTSRATSADVARRAGVSRATVSYVMNDTPHQKIPESTRQRVREAAASLGYLPSAAARTLRSGRSDVVLLLLPDWPIGSAVGQLLQAMSATLAESGLTFVVHPRAGVARPVTEVWKAITPAAVVALGEVDEHEAALIRAAGVRLVVSLLGDSPRPEFELEHTQQQIGRLQVEHLAAAGHRRLGYGWNPDVRVRAFAQARLDGARQACADLRLDAPAVESVPLETRTAANAISAWRTAFPAITAVCAYNDDTALALLAGLRLHGLDAPDGLAVVGVDDIPAAALTSPPLTTVLVDQGAVAEHTARSIIAALHEEPAPRPDRRVVQLIRRESA